MEGMAILTLVHNGVGGNLAKNLSQSLAKIFLRGLNTGHHIVKPRLVRESSRITRTRGQDLVQDVHSLLRGLGAFLCLRSPPALPWLSNPLGQRMNECTLSCV